jgi:hypothetical protein
MDGRFDSLVDLRYVSRIRPPENVGTVIITSFRFPFKDGKRGIPVFGTGLLGEIEGQGPGYYAVHGFSRILAFPFQALINLTGQVDLQSH